MRGAGAYSPAFNGPTRGRGAGLGARGSATGSPMNARGRGGGIAAGRGGAVVGGQGYQGSSGRGSSNPLLVPVTFVKATNPGFGTVGGKDDEENKENVNGLEKAGALDPRKSIQDTSQEGSALVESIRQMELADQDSNKSKPQTRSRTAKKQGSSIAPPPALVEYQSTTDTMAVDEPKESAPPASIGGHPGIGAAAYPHIVPLSQDLTPTPPSTDPPSPADNSGSDSAREESPPLFEISTERTPIVLDESLAPPTIPSNARPEELSSSSDSEEEQIVYPPRGRAQADPVLAPSPSAPVSQIPKPPTISLNIRSASSYPASTTQQLETNPYRPPGPKLSKKQQKRASKIARKKGKEHARTGNMYAGGGRRLVGDSDYEEGEEMLARMGMGANAGIDDMLDQSDDSEDETIHNGEGHVDGQPRMDDSDVEWGTSAPPALKRGKAKRNAQRQQRTDQQEAEKLNRLLDADGTREEVELRLALEMSIVEDEQRKKVEKESRRREREREAVRDDYAGNIREDIGEEDIAAMRSFARGVVGGPNGEHERGDDVDQDALEAEDDEDAWHTSDDSEELNTEEEDYKRNLGLESESSEDVDSDVELEMDYTLGDADGR